MGLIQAGFSIIFASLSFWRGFPWDVLVYALGSCFDIEQYRH